MPSRRSRSALHRGVTALTGALHCGTRDQARTSGPFCSCVADLKGHYVEFCYCNGVWMTGVLTIGVAVRWCKSSGSEPDRARERPSPSRRGFQHGERCCWETGKILLSMRALVKDPGPPELGTWVSKQPLTIPVCGAADSGLRSGFITRPGYGWSGQMTNKPGAFRADERTRCVQAQISRQHTVVLKRGVTEF